MTDPCELGHRRRDTAAEGRTVLRAEGRRMSADESPLDQTTLTACGAVFGLTAAEMAELTEDSGPHYRPTRCMHEGEAGFRYCGADAERVLFGITMCEVHYAEHLGNLGRSDDRGISDAYPAMMTALAMSFWATEEAAQSLAKSYINTLPASDVESMSVSVLDLLDEGEL